MNLAIGILSFINFGAFVAAAVLAKHRDQGLGTSLLYASIAGLFFCLGLRRALISNFGQADWVNFLLLPVMGSSLATIFARIREFTA